MHFYLTCTEDAVFLVLETGLDKARYHIYVRKVHESGTRSSMDILC